jgi:hypothetical protein
MFGAVLTYIHNGDPLNDSTGTMLADTTASTACLLIALVGSFGVRRLSSPIPSIAAPASTR